MLKLDLRLVLDALYLLCTSFAVRRPTASQRVPGISKLDACKIMYVIIRDDFHESKSEGYPLQGVNIGNDKNI